MKPTKKQISKWTQALRSGAYTQTQHCLQDDKGFCCLGVACKVFIPADKQRTIKALHPKSEHLYGILPERQPKAPVWLAHVNEHFEAVTGLSLSSLNDQMQLTFDEIADVLEAVYIHEVLK